MADEVGPVLRMSDDLPAVVRAIEEDNPGREITVVDRGAYVRVLGGAPLQVTRASLERHLGRAFEMREFEQLMSAFSGRIDSTTDHITWDRKGGH